MTGAIALLAGGALPRAAALGVAMTALQVSIGALNDVVDAPRDAAGQPWKPIPSGLVSRTGGLAAAVVAAAIGLGLSAALGPDVALLAGVVLGVGYAYDLAFKGTAWSWLPFAVGIPILPVFAWFGAVGRLPAAFLVLVPAAVLAGAGLALANSLVDLDADRAAEVGSPAQAWGADRTRVAARLLLGVVAATAVAAAGWLGAPTPLLGLVAVAALVVGGAGRWLAAGRRQTRERAWEVEAAGVGLLAAAWLASVAQAGRLG